MSLNNKLKKLKSQIVKRVKNYAPNKNSNLERLPSVQAIVVYKEPKNKEFTLKNESINKSICFINFTNNELQEVITKNDVMVEDINKLTQKVCKKLIKKHEIVFNNDATNATINLRTNFLKTNLKTLVKNNKKINDFSSKTKLKSFVEIVRNTNNIKINKKTLSFKLGSLDNEQALNEATNQMIDFLKEDLTIKKIGFKLVHSPVIWFDKLNAIKE